MNCLNRRIPDKDNETQDPEIRAKAAWTDLSAHTEGEINALTRLTRGKCPYTPKLLSILSEKQDHKMWIPGGFIVFILMEKVPGVPLDNFWSDMTRSQRDEVRNAFRKTLM